MPRGRTKPELELIVDHLREENKQLGDDRYEALTLAQTSQELVDVALAVIDVQNRIAGLFIKVTNAPDQ